MGKKYIVKLDDNKLAYTAIIIDGVPYIKPLQLLPYTEPDKESCMNCYFAKNPKAQEPCVRCSHSFYNFFRPKEQKEEIQVGDEVLYEDEKGVVIVPEENGHYAAAFTAGGMRICEPDYKLRKTGKHYPEIVKILQEMRKK